MLYGVKGTGKVKEHDAHCALRPIQVRISPVKQIDDGILHADASPISKLQWVQVAVNQEAEVLRGEVAGKPQS